MEYGIKTMKFLEKMAVQWWMDAGITPFWSDPVEAAKR